MSRRGARGQTPPENDESLVRDQEELRRNQPPVFDDTPTDSPVESFYSLPTRGQDEENPYAQVLPEGAQALIDFLAKNHVTVEASPVEDTEEGDENMWQFSYTIDQESGAHLQGQTVSRHIQSLLEQCGGPEVGIQATQVTAPGRQKPGRFELSEVQLASAAGFQAFASAPGAYEDTTGSYRGSSLQGGDYSTLNFGDDGGEASDSGEGEEYDTLSHQPPSTAIEKFPEDENDEKIEEASSTEPSEEGQDSGPLFEAEKSVEADQLSPPVQVCVKNQPIDYAGFSKALESLCHGSKKDGWEAKSGGENTPVYSGEIQYRAPKPQNGSASPLPRVVYKVSYDTKTGQVTFQADPKGQQVWIRETAAVLSKFFANACASGADAMGSRALQELKLSVNLDEPGSAWERVIKEYMEQHDLNARQPESKTKAKAAIMNAFQAELDRGDKHGFSRVVIIDTSSQATAVAAPFLASARSEPVAGSEPTLELNEHRGEGLYHTLNGGFASRERSSSSQSADSSTYSTLGSGGRSSAYEGASRGYHAYDEARNFAPKPEGENLPEGHYTDMVDRRNQFQNAGENSGGNYPPMNDSEIDEAPAGSPGPTWMRSDGGMDRPRPDSVLYQEIEEGQEEQEEQERGGDPADPPDASHRGP